MQEDESTEFKEIVVDGIKKEVVSFANTRGGTLYIGIKDDGTVAGLENADFALQQASNLIRDSIKPDITMFIRYVFETLDDRQVLAIHVEEGSNKPYYLAKNGLKPSGVFVRQGASSVPASEEQIRRMIRETDGDCFEKMRSLNQNLTFDTAEKLFKSQNLDFGDTQKRTLGLYDDAGLFTNTALLISEQNPFTIKCAVFSNEEQTEFKDRKEVSGSLFLQLSEVYNYIDRYNNLNSKFEGLHRIDSRDYPETAIREALLNSLVHRDYSYSASTLVSIYSDRIEIVSIGGLLQGVSLEDVKMGLSVCRNKNLADIFYRLTLIESYGTGLRKIMNSYSSYERKPEMLVTQNAFKIILPNKNSALQKTIASGFITNEELILKYAGEHESFSRSEIDALLKTSPATSNRILKKLLAENKLLARGNGKALRYFIERR